MRDPKLLRPPVVGGVEGEKVIPYDARVVDILCEISGDWTWEDKTVQALITKDGICVSQE